MKPISKRTRSEREIRDEDKRTILYIEDEDENRNVAMLRLKKNYNLLLASNSKEACAILTTQAAVIEAILMDIELQGSELDGIMLTQLIRGTLPKHRIPQYAKSVPVLKIPILFVTAHGDRYSEDFLIQAGGNQLIRKPVDFVQLSMSLTRIRLTHGTMKLDDAQTNKVSYHTSNHPPVIAPEKKIVLFIDHDAQNIESTKTVLGKDFELLGATKASQAAQILTHQSHKMTGILVASGFKDGDIDEYALIKMIRGTANRAALPLYAQRLPVIMKPILVVASAEERRQNEDAYVNAGADRLIRKPIDLVQLKMALTLTRLEQKKR